MSALTNSQIIDKNVLDSLLQNFLVSNDKLGSVYTELLQLCSTVGSQAAVDHVVMHSATTLLKHEPPSQSSPSENSASMSGELKQDIVLRDKLLAHRLQNMFAQIQEANREYQFSANLFIDLLNELREDNSNAGLRRELLRVPFIRITESLLEPSDSSFAFQMSEFCEFVGNCSSDLKCTMLLLALALHDVKSGHQNRYVSVSNDALTCLSQPLLPNKSDFEINKKLEIEKEQLASYFTATPKVLITSGSGHKSSPYSISNECCAIVTGVSIKPSLGHCYYEVTIKGEMRDGIRIGWTLCGDNNNSSLGDDITSWGYDGFAGFLFHNAREFAQARQETIVFADDTVVTTESSAVSETVTAAAEDDSEFATYRKSIKIGIPHEAVRHSMTSAGMSQSKIDGFFATIEAVSTDLSSSKSTSGGSNDSSASLEYVIARRNAFKNGGICLVGTFGADEAETEAEALALSIQVESWKEGNVLGCLLEKSSGKIGFYLNGKLLQTDNSLGESLTIPMEDFQRVGVCPSFLCVQGANLEINIGQSSFQHCPIVVSNGSATAPATSSRSYPAAVDIGYAGSCCITSILVDYFAREIKLSCSLTVKGNLSLSDFAKKSTLQLTSETFTLLGTVSDCTMESTTCNISFVFALPSTFPVNVMAGQARFLYGNGLCPPIIFNCHEYSNFQLKDALTFCPTTAAKQAASAGKPGLSENRANVPIILGKDSVTYYCGRRLGQQAIPYSDGTCGPTNGPQCADCKGLLLYPPKCTNGHVMLPLSACPEEYSGPPMCDGCREKNLYQRNKYFYHCKACSYDLCEGCCVRFAKSQVKAASAEKSKAKQSSTSSKASIVAAPSFAPGASGEACCLRMKSDSWINIAQISTRMISSFSLDICLNVDAISTSGFTKLSEISLIVQRKAAPRLVENSTSESAVESFSSSQEPLETKSLEDIHLNFTEGSSSSSSGDSAPHMETITLELGFSGEGKLVVLLNGIELGVSLNSVFRASEWQDIAFSFASLDSAASRSKNFLGLFKQGTVIATMPIEPLDEQLRSVLSFEGMKIDNVKVFSPPNSVVMFGHLRIFDGFISDCSLINRQNSVLAPGLMFNSCCDDLVSELLIRDYLYPRPASNMSWNGDIVRYFVRENEINSFASAFIESSKPVIRLSEEVNEAESVTLRVIEAIANRLCQSADNFDILNKNVNDKSEKLIGLFCKSIVEPEKINFCLITFCLIQIVELLQKRSSSVNNDILGKIAVSLLKNLKFNISLRTRSSSYSGKEFVETSYAPKCLAVLLKLMEESLFSNILSEKSAKQIPSLARSCFGVSFNRCLGDPLRKYRILSSLLLRVRNLAQSDLSAETDSGLEHVFQCIDLMSPAAAQALASSLFKYLSTLSNFQSLFPTELDIESTSSALTGSFRKLGKDSKISIGNVVIRGSDWIYGNQDGGNNGIGIIVDIGTWPGDNSPGSSVTVFWRSNSYVDCYRYGARELLSTDPVTEKFAYDIDVIKLNSATSPVETCVIKAGKTPRFCEEDIVAFSSGVRTDISLYDVLADLSNIASSEWLLYHLPNAINTGNKSRQLNRQDVGFLYLSVLEKLAPKVEHPPSRVLYELGSVIQHCLAVIGDSTLGDPTPFESFVLGFQSLFTNASQLSSASTSASAVVAYPEPSKRLANSEFGSTAGKMKWNWSENAWGSVDSSATADSGQAHLSQSSKFGFSSEHCHSAISVRSDSLEIVQKANREWGTVLGNFPMKPNTGTHKWKAVVKSVGSKRCHCIFGIATADIELDNFIGFDDNGWGLSSNKELLHSQSRYRSEYPCKIQVGNVIEITFDSDAGVLIFADTTSSKKSEIAFKGLRNNVFYAAFTVYAPGDTVELISYSPGKADTVFQKTQILPKPSIGQLQGSPHPFIVNYAINLIAECESKLKENETNVLLPMISVGLMQLLASFHRWQHIPFTSSKTLYSRLIQFLSIFNDCMNNAKLKLTPFVINPVDEFSLDCESRVSSVASTPAPTEDILVKVGNPFASLLAAPALAQEPESTPAAVSSKSGATTPTENSCIIDAATPSLAKAADFPNSDETCLQLLTQLSVVAGSLVGKLATDFISANSASKMNEYIATFASQMHHAVDEQENISVVGKRLSSYEIAITSDSSKWLSSSLFSNGVVKALDKVLPSSAANFVDVYSPLFFEWVSNKVKLPENVAKCVRVAFVCMVYHTGLATVVGFANELLQKGEVKTGLAVPSFLTAMWREARKLQAVVSKLAQSSRSQSADVWCNKIEHQIAFLFSLQPAMLEHSADRQFTDISDLVAHLSREKMKSLYFGSKASEICSQIIEFTTSGASIPWLRGAIHDANARSASRTDGLKYLRSSLTCVSDDIGWATKCALIRMLPNSLRSVRNSQALSSANLVYFGNGFSGCHPQYRLDMKGAFDELFSHLMYELSQASSAGNICYLLELINCLAIGISKDEHVLLARLDVFVALNEILDGLTMSESCDNVIGTPPKSTELAKPGAKQDYKTAVKACLKLFILYALQVASFRSEPFCSRSASRSELSTSVSASRSGPITLGMKVFDILLLQLTNVVDRMAAQLKERKDCLPTQSIFQLQLGSDQASILSEIVSLLMFTIQDESCRAIVSKSKWIVILLEVAMLSPLESRHKAIRILSDILPFIDLATIDSNSRLESACTTYLSIFSLNSDALHSIPNSKKVLMIFLAFASPLFAPHLCHMAVSTTTTAADEGTGAVGFSQTAFPVQAEMISLLRSLLQSRVWYPVLEDVLVQQLELVPTLFINQGTKSSTDDSRDLSDENTNLSIVENTTSTCLSSGDVRMALSTICVLGGHMEVPYTNCPVFILDNDGHETEFGVITNFIESSDSAEVQFISMVSSIGSVFTGKPKQSKVVSLNNLRPINRIQFDILKLSDRLIRALFNILRSAIIDCSSDDIVAGDFNLHMLRLACAKSLSSLCSCSETATVVISYFLEEVDSDFSATCGYPLANSVVQLLKKATQMTSFGGLGDLAVLEEHLSILLSHRLMAVFKKSVKSEIKQEPTPATSPTKTAPKDEIPAEESGQVENEAMGALPSIAGISNDSYSTPPQRVQSPVRLHVGSTGDPSAIYFDYAGLAATGSSETSEGGSGLLTDSMPEMNDPSPASAPLESTNTNEEQQAQSLMAEFESHSWGASVGANNAEMMATLESLGFPRRACEVACANFDDVTEAINFIISDYNPDEHETEPENGSERDVNAAQQEQNEEQVVDHEQLMAQLDQLGELETPLNAMEFNPSTEEHVSAGDSTSNAEAEGMDEVMEGLYQEAANLAGQSWAGNSGVGISEDTLAREFNDDLRQFSTPSNVNFDIQEDHSGNAGITTSNGNVDDIPAGMVISEVEYRSEFHYDCFRSKFLAIFSSPSTASERIGAIFPADELEVVKECADPQKPYSKWYQIKLSDIDTNEIGYGGQYQRELYGWVPAYVDNNLVIIESQSIGPQVEMNVDRESISISRTYEVNLSLSVRNDPDMDGDEGIEDEEDDDDDDMGSRTHRDCYTISPGERVLAVEEVINSEGMICLRIVSPCAGWITKVFGYVKKVDDSNAPSDNRVENAEGNDDDEDVKSAIVDEWDSLFELADNLEDLDGQELFKKEDRLFGTRQGYQYQRFKDPKKAKSNVFHARRTRILNNSERKAAYSSISKADHNSAKDFIPVTGGMAILYCRRAMLALFLKSKVFGESFFPNILIPCVANCFCPQASSAESVTASASVSMSTSVSLSTAPSLAVMSLHHIVIPEIEDQSCVSHISESSSLAISHTNMRHNPDGQLTELCNLIVVFISLVAFRGDPYYRCHLEHLVYDDLTLAALSSKLLTVDLLLRPWVADLLLSAPNSKRWVQISLLNQVRYFQSQMQPILISSIINHIRMASESLNKDQFWLEFTYEEDVDNDCFSQPNIHFAHWCSTILLETGNPEIFAKLFRLWCIGGLRASSLSLKQISSDFLSDIIAGMRWAAIQDNSSLTTTAKSNVIWVKAMKESIQVLPLDRLHIVASKRLWYEMEDDPAYSRFLQSLLHLLSESRLASEFVSQLISLQPDEACLSPLHLPSSSHDVLISSQAGGEVVSDGSQLEQQARPYISFTSNASELQLSPTKDIQGPWTLEFWIKRSEITSNIEVTTGMESQSETAVESAGADSDNPQKATVPTEYLLHSSNGHIKLQTGGRIFPDIIDPLAEVDPVVDEALCLSFSQRGNSDKLIMDCAVPIGRWVHVAIVSKVQPAPSVSVFIDGIQKDTKSFKFQLPVGSVGYGKTKQSFLGDLAEMRVWSSARTSAEIARDMLIDVSQAKGLIVHLCCKEGSGIRTLDTMGLLTSCKLASCEWKVGLAPILKPHAVSAFVVSEPEECDGFFGRSIGRSAGVIEMTGTCIRHRLVGINDRKYSSDEKEIVCLAYRVIEDGAAKSDAPSTDSKIEGFIDWSDRGIRSSFLGTLNQQNGSVHFEVLPNSTVLGSPELADWNSDTLVFDGVLDLVENIIRGDYSYQIQVPSYPPLLPGAVSVDLENLPKSISVSDATNGDEVYVLKEDPKKAKRLIGYNIKAYPTAAISSEDSVAVASGPNHLEFDQGSHWVEWTLSCSRSSIIVGVFANDAIIVDNGEYVSSRNGIYDNSGVWSYYQTGNLSNGSEKVEKSKLVDGDVVGISLNMNDGEITFYRNNEFVHCFKNVKSYVPPNSSGDRVGFRPLLCLSRTGDVVYFNGAKTGPCTIKYPESSFDDNRSKLCGVVSNGAINGIGRLYFHNKSDVQIGYYLNGKREGPQLTIQVDEANIMSLCPLVQICSKDEIVRSVELDEFDTFAENTQDCIQQFNDLLGYVTAEYLQEIPGTWNHPVINCFPYAVSLIDSEAAQTCANDKVRIVVQSREHPSTVFFMSKTATFQSLMKTYCGIFKSPITHTIFEVSLNQLSNFTTKFVCGNDYFNVSLKQLSGTINGNAFVGADVVYDLANRKLSASTEGRRYEIVFSSDFLRIESGFATDLSNGEVALRFGSVEGELSFSSENPQKYNALDIDQSPSDLGVDTNQFEVVAVRLQIVRETDKAALSHLLKTSTAPYILRTLLKSGATVRTGVEIEENPQVRMLECAEIVESFAFCRTREGVGRYRIQDGWISERLRGGDEDLVVRIVRQRLDSNPHEYRVVFPDGAILRRGEELDTVVADTCPLDTLIRCDELRSVFNGSEFISRVRICEPEEYAGTWASAKPNILTLLNGSGSDSGKQLPRPSEEGDSDIRSELSRRRLIRSSRVTTASTETAANPTSLQMVNRKVTGSINVDANNLFLLSNANKSSSNLSFSEDFRSVSCTGSGRSLVLGTRGFTRGLHYWEVQIDALGSWGSLFIGVAPAESTQWNHGYGLINYRATQAFGTETIYGSYYAANDVVGVLLDMDHGTISYIKDGDNIGKSVVINMGVAYHNLRRNSLSRSSSGTLFPCFGMKSSGDKITIKQKWISSRGLGPSSLLEHLLNAKSVVSRWRGAYFTESRAFTALPTSLIQEMYQAYLRWRGQDKVLIKTRAGTEISVDTSEAAIKLSAGSIGDVFTLREGTKFRSSYGDGCIVGARKGQIWFTLDNSDTGAWFWTPSDLSEVVSNGVVTFDDSYASNKSSVSSPASLSNSTSISLTIAEFTNCLQDPSWTIHEDEVIAQVINEISDKCSIDALRIPPNLLDANRYRKNSSPPELCILPKRSTVEIEVRYAALCVLNKAASIALPFCDLATADERIPLILSPMVRQLIPSYSLNRVQNPDFTTAKSASGIDVLDLKSVIFSRIKIALWDRALTETTTHTSAPPDEFERPDDLREYKINRPESFNAETKAMISKKAFSDRLKSSIFGQMYEHIRSVDEKALRRSFVHVEDAGQRRNFFVKFIGEGVDDHGGPYRAVFQSAVGEEPAGVLELLVPCPNAASEAGENRDKYLINTKYLWQPTMLPLYSHLGVMMGIACRHKITVPFAIPALLWRSFVCEEAKANDLESIDTQFIHSLEHISVGDVELDFIGDLLTEQLLKSWDLPSEDSSSDSTNTSRSKAYVGGSDTGSASSSGDSEGLGSYAALLAKRLVFGSSAAAVSSFSNSSSSNSNSSSNMSSDGAVTPNTDIKCNSKRVQRICALIKQLRLTSQQEGISCLLRGVSTVVPTELLSIFTAKEAELLFCGQPDIDVQVLKSMTIYDSVSPNDRHIQLFWDVVSNMTAEEKSLLVNFCSGRSRLPSSSNEMLMRFKITGPPPRSKQNPDNYLPLAQTCFFSLSIPEYTSYEVCSAKVHYAIRNTQLMDADFAMRNADGWENVN